MSNNKTLLTIDEFLAACHYLQASDIKCVSYLKRVGDFQSDFLSIQDKLYNSIKIESVGYQKKRAILCDEIYESNSEIVDKYNARFSISTLVEAVNNMSDKEQNILRRFGFKYNFSILIFTFILFVILCYLNCFNDFFNNFAVSGLAGTSAHIKTRPFLLKYGVSSFTPRFSLSVIRSEIIDYMTSHKSNLNTMNKILLKSAVALNDCVPNRKVTTQTKTFEQVSNGLGIAKASAIEKKIDQLINAIESHINNLNEQSEKGGPSKDACLKTIRAVFALIEGGAFYHKNANISSIKNTILEFFPKERLLSLSTLDDISATSGHLKGIDKISGKIVAEKIKKNVVGGYSK